MYFLRNVWRKNPNSLKKTLNFMCCWVKRSFINFVKRILWQSQNYLSLLVNSAKVKDEDFFFVCKNIVSVRPSDVHEYLHGYTRDARLLMPLIGSLRTASWFCSQWWRITLCPEGFATEVTLVRPLPAVYTQVHVQVVLLGERMAA